RRRQIRERRKRTNRSTGPPFAAPPRYRMLSRRSGRTPPEMSRRHRGPYDVVPASALDVPERPRRLDVEVSPQDAETQPEVPPAAPSIPEIAPPLLLDPIPPPTVIE